MIKRTLKYILSVALFLTLFSGQKLTVAAQASDEKANVILEQARQAVYGKTINNLKAAQIKRKVSAQTSSTLEVEGSDKPQMQVVNRETEEEILMEFPDKIKSISKTYEEGKSTVDNFATLETTLNGTQTTSKMEITRDGKVVSLKDLLDKLPASLSVAIKAKTPFISPDDSFTKNSLWIDIFPIFLQTPSSISVSFTYVGKAEVDQRKMDIIEAKLENSKTFRLFFDERTHLLSLLMPVEDSSQTDDITETKYFFSDYENVNNLLVAKKINIQIVSNTKNSAVKLVGKELKTPKIKNRESKMIAEVVLTQLKLNVPFKPNTFEVKK